MTAEATGRAQQLLQHLDMSSRIVEIGPSHNPVAPKGAGWNTTVVDHAPRAALVEKYADHGIDLSLIEEVDVVWSGGDLAARFPPESLGGFDAVIASHVLEHMCDPITFLQSASRLLSDTGVVVLAVPDKRYCFDFFTPLTTTADWLCANELKAEVHGKRAAFNHVAYASREFGRSLAHNLADAYLHFQAASETGQGNYLDYHAWRFTPSSLQLLLLESALLAGIPLHVAECSPVFGHEFFLVLRKGAPQVRLEQCRLSLLRDIVAELTQQGALL